MTSDETEPADEPERPFTLSDDDVEVDPDDGPPVLAADVEVMSIEPRDFRDVLDDRPPPPPPDSDVEDANKDTDGHDGDAFKWP